MARIKKRKKLLHLWLQSDRQTDRQTDDKHLVEESQIF